MCCKGWFRKWWNRLIFGFKILMLASKYANYTPKNQMFVPKTKKPKKPKTPKITQQSSAYFTHFFSEKVL